MLRGVEQVIPAKSIALPGGLAVRRVLPRPQKREIGPFAYLDEMGPAPRGGAGNFHTPPHPHAGLATFTWLFQGAIRHRDAMGYDMMLEPGAVNWMFTGNGTVHSEQTGQHLPPNATLHGLQFWLAAPAERYGDAPFFQTFPADTIPSHEIEGARVRVLAGSFAGLTSPVPVMSPTVLAEITLGEATDIALPLPGGVDLAVYVVLGQVRVMPDEAVLPPGSLALLQSQGDLLRVLTDGPATVMVLGGAPLPGTRVIQETFILGSREACNQARADFAAGKFGEVIERD